LSEQEYKELLPLLESLKDVCSGIITGGKELKDRLILGFKEELKHHFFFIRLLITKEFESGTGMNFDKWSEFADALSKRFEDIFNALQNVGDNCYESESEKIPESLTQLEQASNPFLENYNATVESLSKLQKWLAGAPEAAKSAPPGFFNEERKREMTEGALQGAADTKKLIEALEEAKTKILTIKSFKK
jgi:membrane-associated HD superfamily phosphohydrolase